MPDQHTPSASNYWLIFIENQLLLLDGQNLFLNSTPFLKEMKPNFTRHFYVGMHHQSTCYCAQLPAEYPLPNHIHPTPLRNAFEILGKEWFNLIAKAFNLIQWDVNHCYCGRCGTKTIHNPPAFERICPACQLAHYPRISPSIIVLIHHGDDILMVRSPHFAPGIYGLVAGFVETGESIEETIHREVMEEVGLKIDHLRYIQSQPWPFPDSLMIGFFAEYVSGEINPDPNEIEEAGWYHYSQLPGRPRMQMSIAQQLINLFIAERQ